MLSLDRQEAYRRRYAEMNPGWCTATHVYQELVAAHLTPTTCVLDLGCGRGGVLERLHPHAGFVAGLDADLVSLREHRAHGLALVCGLAERLPYSDGVFDLVCSSWVLEHLPDPLSAFHEIARVLRPGGWFVFLTPNRCHPLLILNRLLRPLQRQLVSRIYARSGSDTFPALYRANTFAQIERLAQEAGLRRVSLYMIGDPTYLAFSEPLFRLACLLERITPPGLRVHIVGEYVMEGKSSAVTR
ncbi:MAG: class I SAM-dependent methyltransferase [Anaerolineae bacterium]|nr:class I SAM-dependent methyltransferase [Anaerolineae bacterium]